MNHETIVHIIDKITKNRNRKYMSSGILILKCKECNSEVLGRQRRKFVLCDKCQMKNYVENQKKGREIVKNSFVRYWKKVKLKY